MMMTFTAEHTAHQMSSDDCSKEPSGNPELVQVAMFLRAVANLAPLSVNTATLALPVPTSTPRKRRESSPSLSAAAAATADILRCYAHAYEVVGEEEAWF